MSSFSPKMIELINRSVQDKQVRLNEIANKVREFESQIESLETEKHLLQQTFHDMARLNNSNNNNNSSSSSSGHNTSDNNMVIAKQKPLLHSCIDTINYILAALVVVLIGIVVVL
jgi:septal ring factor EnvC (AmiA/AmiB activator)